MKFDTLSKDYKYMELDKQEAELLLGILVQLNWKTDQAEVALQIKQLAVKLQSFVKQSDTPITPEILPIEPEVIDTTA